MLENLVLQFKVIGDGAVNKIDATMQAIKQQISQVQEKFSTMKNNISQKLNNLQTKATSIFKNIFSKLKSQLTAIRSPLRRFGNYAVQQFQRSQKQANNFMGIVKRLAGMIAAGFTIKTAIDGAANIEQFRNTLETVLKDPDKARQKLAWASRIANKTPFETEEVVGGMTKLQSYGIEGDRVLKTTKRTYLEMIGDMAAGMGKSFDQAIEAVADAKTGELERLKEFGITKNMVADFGKSQGLEIFNNKGQIQDMELFNKTLFELMNSRFGGAMEKQSKTFKGGISTIQGALKSALANMAGVNEFGDIVENSPFQILRDRVIIPFSEMLVKFQEEGTFTKWADSLANAFSIIIDIGGRVIEFIKEWKEIIIPLISALAGLFVINKIVVLIGALKTALAGLAFNPIMLAIGAVIFAGVLLYRNWDLIKEKLSNLWQKIKEFGSNLFNVTKKILFFCTPLGLIVTIGKAIINNWDLIKQKIGQLWDKIKSFARFLFDLGKKVLMSCTPLGMIIKIGELLINNWDLIKQKATELWGKIKSLFKEGYDFIAGMFIAIKETVASSLSYIWETIIVRFEKMKEVFNILVEIFKEIWEKIKVTAASTFDFILDYVSKIWEKIKSFFSGLGEKIKSLSGISFSFKSDSNKSNEVTNIDGSHKGGLDYVPFDGYIAELHEGERVLTEEENNNYNQILNNSSEKRNVNKENINNFASSNEAKSNKKIKVVVNINIENVNNSTDVNKVIEMFEEKFQNLKLINDIEEGLI